MAGASPSALWAIFKLLIVRTPPRCVKKPTSRGIGCVSRNRDSHTGRRLLRKGPASRKGALQSLLPLTAEDFAVRHVEVIECSDAIARETRAMHDGESCWF